MAGPIMNPTPKAIPMIAIDFERFFSSEISDKYARATAMFPPVNPSKQRDSSNSPNEFEYASNIYDNNVPILLNTRIGFRPNRSDSFPKIGAEMNCAHE